MKARNYHFHGDAATVKRLKEEYEFIGRWVKQISPGHLIVLAYPPKKESKKKYDNRGKGKGTARPNRTQASKS